MSMDERMLLIRTCDIFAEINDQEYEELNLIHRFIEADKGEYIYFESAYHNKLYFIKDGHIKIGYIDDNGNEIIKEIISKGEVFGQFTLEKDNLNGEFAQAYKTGVSLCAFNIEDFEQLLQKKPYMALKYSKQVGNKLRQIENRLVNLLNKDVKTRLLYFFKQLAQQEDAVQTTSGICLPNYLTHDDIAKLIGSSRQTVTTLINELEAAQLVKYSRTEICITNLKQLEQLSAH
ncbi:MAG: Crp/Fnr family transcriptional regulator [Sphingobacteriales bacterium]|jgi:CRP/FNR family transcriptional regulator, cyclic AMP receptor protein|nr:MAG: Crp/Fnr family transcriptional regulator [Sphingobacteriales bacterium]